MRISFTLLISTVAALVCMAQPREPEQSVRGALVVQHRLGASDKDVASVLSRHGARSKMRIPSLRVQVIEVPENAAARKRADLERTGMFTFVEPDYIAHGVLTPNDPMLASQWHIARIDAIGAWNISNGSSTIPVAVIDSGVDSAHPDLAGKVDPGWSFLRGDNNTADVHGHGTAVAGTIGAATDNLIGIAGVGWNTRIMPLVVLDSNNSASYSNIANAITWAVDRGARVINISIAGSNASSVLQSAVNYAWSRNAVVIAAAGNAGTTSPMYPAACDKVVAVGATTSSDTRTSFSNYGSWIDLVAPGASIYTTTRGGGYASWNGTSFASPIVAAVAGLVLGVRPSITNTGIVDLLQHNTADLGTAGFDNVYGWGRVDAFRTVMAAAAISSDTVAPNVSFITPGNGSTVSGAVTIQVSATDNVAVTRSELYINGALAASSNSGQVVWSWNTTTAPNGTAALTAKAWDSSGNVGEAGITATVFNAAVTDTQIPVVSILSPTNGAKVAGAVRVATSATDNVGVSQTVIYINGQLRQSCASSYCEYSWNVNKEPRGTHRIDVGAWDAQGNKGTATITVSR